MYSPENVGEEDDEPLRRVGEHRRRRHEQKEHDQEDVRHRQEDQQPVEVAVLAPVCQGFYPNLGGRGKYVQYSAKRRRLGCVNSPRRPERDRTRVHAT